MQTYKCPSGHQVHAEDRQDVICHKCDIIAMHINRRDGIASEWMDRDEYHEGCRDLQDQLDSAFDNQYFGGGW